MGYYFDDYVGFKLNKERYVFKKRRDSKTR